MEDLKAYIVMVLGGVMTLLAPIQNFMVAMVVLFGVNFLFGLVAAIVNKEGWKTKKALFFIWYCAVFFITACAVFVIGHFMNNEEQAVAVVKILCYMAVYIFGTNIFRNLRSTVKEGTAWHKFFDLCYYVLSVKFIEKFSFIKSWQESKGEKGASLSPSEGGRKEAGNGKTVLDKDDF